MKKQARWLLGAALSVAILGGLAIFARLSPWPAERLSAQSAVGSDPAGVDEEEDSEAVQGLLDLVREPWVGDLDGMLERRLIRVLIVPSETAYFLEKGKPRGFVAEWQVEFETYINKRFPRSDRRMKTRVVIVPTRGDDLLPGVLSGRGDIAASSLTITPEREGKVDFSDPVADGIDEIAVTGPASPEIAVLDDLAGKEVLVRETSSYWEHLERLNERFKSEGKKPIRLQPAPEGLQDADLMQMVNAGLAEIVIVDNYKAELWAKILPDIRLHGDIAVNRGGQTGFMMRKGSPKLRETIDAFIATHKAGTSFGNTVIRRYLGSTEFVRRATAPQEVGRFDQVVDSFRKYGDQYHVNHLLLIAQGYQESRLDHGARSHAGAVGIMQLMPATGRAMKVGDIRDLDANIHAGAKYIRSIMDDYFADEGLDEVNRTLFAFAAYNAGPPRIARLREKTGQRGLSPDIWFDNVELLVSENIGAEPVTYVSNIFQYFVAFRLLEEHRRERQQVKEEFEQNAK